MKFSSPCSFCSINKALGRGRLRVCRGLSQALAAGSVACGPLPTGPSTAASSGGHSLAQRVSLAAGVCVSLCARCPGVPVCPLSGCPHVLTVRVSPCAHCLGVLMCPLSGCPLVPAVRVSPCAHCPGVPVCPLSRCPHVPAVWVSPCAHCLGVPMCLVLRYHRVPTVQVSLCARCLGVCMCRLWQVAPFGAAGLWPQLVLGSQSRDLPCCPP